jgi:cyclophilin family peptidyl-prolyl cis-trans isomerase/mono/diheme cytochrome c family protein
MLYLSVLRTNFAIFSISIFSMLLTACGSGDSSPDEIDNNDTLSCAEENTEFVNTNYATVNAWDGGKLYDTWWLTSSNYTEPAENHPLWANQTTNTLSGSDTWRCSECHGWDYKGDQGAYSSGPHYTGFSGLAAATNKSPIDVFCSIKDGSSINPLHQFGTTDTVVVLDDFDVLKLTKFILETGENGLADSDVFIVPGTNIAAGNFDIGEPLYNDKAGCSACHGISGDQSAGNTTLDELARNNPWEALHKIRYGHPGTNMPSYIDDSLANELTVAEIRNVLAYLQIMPLECATLDTSHGSITLQLYRRISPITVENFLTYVNESFYDGTIFHRVIDGFMIQGGGFTTDYVQKPTHDPITNEANNGLSNIRGTIAMARTSDPHSATAQFFINVENNLDLNYSAPTTSGWGYAVFGKVRSGMDVVDTIRQVQTDASDVPLQQVVINSASTTQCM